MKNTKKGFTLVELLVVIAILAILASVAVVGYTAFIDRAKESNAKTEAHQIETAIESALMVDDVVLVRAEVKNGETVTVKPIYAIKDTNGNITFAYALSDGKTVDDDLSANFVGFNLSVSETGGKLVYTSADNVTINDVLADD